jgi:uncharacterized protein involved in tolerance to divalent cations
MVNIIIYLKKEHNAKELVKFLLNEKLIASASIDENNVSYEIENHLLSENVYSVITAQSKALLFNDIVNVVVKRVGEDIPINSTPIVASNKVFDTKIKSRTKPI